MMTNYKTAESFSRKEVAEQLAVTPARITQLATDMGIEPYLRIPYGINRGVYYSRRQINKMKKRCTKRGPTKQRSKRQ